MTVVEFLSDDPVENVASLVSLEPERVIFLGRSEWVTRHRACCERLNAALGGKTELLFRTIDLWDFEGISETLTTVCAQYEDVCFDLTGGDETLLAAAGSVHATNPAVRLHRFDLKNGVCRSVPDGKTLPLKAPLCLSIAQFVPLFGGAVGSSADGDPLTAWTYSDDALQTLLSMWRVCARDPNRWNKAIGSVCSMLKYAAFDPRALRVTIDRGAAESRMARFAEKATLVGRVLDELEREGVVQVDGALSFSYASPLVRHVMAKEGNLLELYTLFTAAGLCAADGRRLFCDAKCGVYMDWDGVFGQPNNTHNEIDVMLMCGVTPVFISCKNGDIDDKELYKLSAVAQRFGGDRAKKALVATFVERNPMAYADFKERAAQMGVTLIDRVETLFPKDFEARLRALGEE